MKRLFVILFCLVSSISYCQQVMTIRGTGPDGKTRNVAVTASGAIETTGSVSGVASISTDISALADQQAYETLQILAAQASTTTKVTDAETGILALSAQQASESIDTLAAIATVTLDMASISSDIGRVETETASGGVAVTAAVTAQSAQQALEALAIQAAIASVTAGAGQPFTQDLESSAIASTVANIANRSWICIQNKSTSEPVFINNDTVATPGYGLKLFPGGSFTRAWGAGVPVTFVSTNSAMIFVDQEVSP